MKAFATFTFGILLSSVSMAQSYNWVVTKQWSDSYERKFSEFVTVLGQSGCGSLHQCLTSSKSNPFYAGKTPANKKFLADCADLPYALRMYFSWMEGLPFDYVSEVSAAEPAQETSSDLRYNKYGNKPTAKVRIVPGRTYNGYDEMIKLTWQVSTATYRMHYNQVSDFYPASLDRQGIRPGTVVYDPAGHAAIIYKIEKDGRIKMIDAHPDQSITHITYDKKFQRSRAAHGAGFKNWRPELDQRSTDSLNGFSLQQFNKSFAVNNRPVDYYDYVRTQMAGGNLQFNPVDELKNGMLELCQNIQDRVVAVNAAIKAGIDQKNHPSRLPENIYGTSGEWEEYSSPSRDARLKVAFASLYQDSLRLIKGYKDGQHNIVYNPTSSKYSGKCSAGDAGCYLIASMLEAYEVTANSSACQFAYKNSNGASVSMNYHTVMQRLFAASFDPYDCVELRWGARGNELASCRNDSNKMRWYNAEQGLRNQVERTYDARMDYDVVGTQRLGVAQPPEVDLYKKLQTLF